MDVSDPRRVAVVYVMESRDLSKGQYDQNVIQPLRKMANDVRLQPMVAPLLQRASERKRTCAETSSGRVPGGQRIIPANKMASLYIIGASMPLKAGMPFHNVSNFKYAWPLHITIPLGYDIDLLECGWTSHVQGSQGEQFCNGEPAKVLRRKVMQRLQQLQLEQVPSASSVRQAGCEAAAASAGLPSELLSSPAPAVLEQAALNGGTSESCESESGGAEGSDGDNGGSGGGGGGGGGGATVGAGSSDRHRRQTRVACKTDSDRDYM